MRNLGAIHTGESSSDGGGSQHGSALADSNEAPPPMTQDLKDAQKLPEATSGNGVCSRINVLIGTLTLIVILLVVVLVVLLNKNDTSSQQSSNLLSSTLAPSQYEENGACVDALCGFLIGILKPSHPERTWEKILTGGTCQNSALRWLAQSPDIFSVGPDKVQHRYALATTYCELVPLDNTNRGLRVLSSAQSRESWIDDVVFGSASDDCFGGQ